MKLLMITRKVDQDDAGAGFVYAWARKLSQRVNRLKIICLQRGNISGLEDIDIYSLGKEKYFKVPYPFAKLFYIFRFYKYIWRLRKEYDAVFVHMHTIYIFLAGWLWKLWGKKVGLWYAHVRTSFLAKLASYLVDYVFSPSEESYTFVPKKLKKTGQGIDTEIFRPAPGKSRQEKRQIISLGRISPVKEYDTLIEAVKILAKDYQLDKFCIKLVGQPAMPQDFKYQERLKAKISQYKLEEYFSWSGPVANKDAPRFYQAADIFVNMQEGGGFGKAVLEAMASGLVCILCSPVYRRVLGEYADDTIFEFHNQKSMAEKLKAVLAWPEEKVKAYQKMAVAYVRENHNLNKLMDKIVAVYVVQKTSDVF